MSTSLYWTELGKHQVLGPELVSKTEDNVRLIRDHLKVASERQNSDADLKRRDIEYSVGDFVFLRFLRGRKFYGLVEKESLVHDLSDHTKSLRGSVR